MKRRFTRIRSERGAALVEFAIVIVPICVILFGIIEAGFMYKDSLDVSNASRSGARIASAEPLLAGSGSTSGFYADTVQAVATSGNQANFQLNDTLRIYEVRGTVPTGVNADGNPPASCNTSTNCRLFTWNGTAFVGDSNSASGIWPVTSHDVCISDANIDSVGVALSVTHHSLTGFFVFNTTLNEHTVMRLEPPADGSGCNN